LTNVVDFGYGLQVPARQGIMGYIAASRSYKIDIWQQVRR